MTLVRSLQLYPCTWNNENNDVRSENLREGMHFSPNRPFSNSHGWTGSSMKWRLMRANLFKCKCIRLHFMLDPGQPLEYETGLLTPVSFYLTKLKHQRLHTCTLCSNIYLTSISHFSNSNLKQQIFNQFL